MSNIGKRETYKLYYSYTIADPRATWCPLQCCPGHKCISTAEVPLWIQTPWRFLLGKDFQLRSKGSLNILIFPESYLTFLHLCFSCKYTVMDRCDMAATHCNQQINCLWPFVVPRWQVTNPSLLLVCSSCICSLQSLSFQESSEWIYFI